jgi:DcaP outer membrane protein
MFKRQLGWKKMRVFFISVVIAAGCIGEPTPVAAESIEELKVAMAQMKLAMEAMEKRIATMEQEKAEVVKTAKVTVPEANKPHIALKVADNTTMSIYGYAKLDILYTDTGGGGKYNYVPSAVPLDSERSSLADNAFTMHARESRIGFTSSTDTDYGQFNTKIEADFYGSEGNERTSNSHGMRLRLAYGELGNLRVGQDWSTLVDASAYPETIDFGYPVGRLFVLQPLVRWTQPFEGGSFQFALENPESYFLTKSLQEDGSYKDNSVGKDLGSEYVPDIIARINLKPAYGRYSIAAIARQFNYDDGQYDDSTWGTAIVANAVLPVYGKDNIRLAFNYGTGLGRYMRADFDDAFIDPVSNKIETNVQLGAFASYQHFWFDSLRSTFTYSYAGRDNNLNYVTSAADKRYQSVHANILWSPIPRIDVGLEYIWGYREIENDEDGDINRLQGAFKYKF